LRGRSGSAPRRISSVRGCGAVADFVHQHALVDLELKVGVSAMLYEHLDAGELDLVLAKRRRARSRQLVWRDRLAWLALRHRIEPPVP